MCDEHIHDNRVDINELGLDGRVPASGHSRRHILAAAALAFASVPFVSNLPHASAAGLATGGLSSTRHAMHVHGAWSEGKASTSAHFAQAQMHGVDCVWTSDHDWRAVHHGLPREYVFTSLSQLNWKWLPEASGSVTATDTKIVGIPDEGYGTSALQLFTQSGTAPASRGVQAITGNLLEGNVIGREINFDMNLLRLTGSSTFDVAVTFSVQRGVSGRLKIVYMFGSEEPRVDVRSNMLAHVYIKIPLGWSSHSLVPLEDIRRLWLDVVAEDNSFTALSLLGSSRNGLIEVQVPKLDLPRRVTGEEALVQREAVLAAVGSRFTDVSHREALEISDAVQHVNWYGPSPRAILGTADIRYVADEIHRNGGVAFFPHPIGVGGGLSSPSQQVSQRNKVFSKHTANNCFGVDGYELGYGQRGGASLATHLQLGDMFWRDGRFVTANGVSDSHNAQSAIKGVNTFVTQMWAAQNALEAQLLALRQGAVSVTRLGSYSDELWIDLNENPMGSVAVNPSTGLQQLRVALTNLPNGGSVQVIRGLVDYGGIQITSPSTSVVAVLTSTQLASGEYILGVNGDKSSYYRVEVLNSQGTVVAFSNPVWGLKSEPQANRPIPAARRVA